MSTHNIHFCGEIRKKNLPDALLPGAMAYQLCFYFTVFRFLFNISECQSSDITDLQSEAGRNYIASTKPLVRYQIYAILDFGVH